LVLGGTSAAAAWMSVEASRSLIIFGGVWIVPQPAETKQLRE